MGRLDDALRQFDLVLEHNSEHSSATTYRLNCGIKVWSEDQYFEEISGACMRYLSNLNFQFARLNYVLSVLNDYQLATEIIETCLSFHPENQRAQLYRALVLSWKGDHDEAISSIKKSMMRWPESNDVCITAAQIEKNAAIQECSWNISTPCSNSTARAHCLVVSYIRNQSSPPFNHVETGFSR